MGSTVSDQYENPVKLTVSFDAPETTTIVLQGPTLQAYYDWLAGDIEEDDLSEAIMEQCEDHVTQWTRLRDWDTAR
jgi:hypothetical protein